MQEGDRRDVNPVDELAVNVRHTQGVFPQIAENLVNQACEDRVSLVVSRGLCAPLRLVSEQAGLARLSSRCDLVIDRFRLPAGNLLVLFPFMRERVLLVPLVPPEEGEVPACAVLKPFLEAPTTPKLPGRLGDGLWVLPIGIGYNPVIDDAVFWHG